MTRFLLFQLAVLSVSAQIGTGQFMNRDAWIIETRQLRVTVMQSGGHIAEIVLKEEGGLIGRSLRAVVDTKLLGERQIYLDCDVIQADGGTRCASITGAYVALALACRKLVKQGTIRTSPILSEVAAVSVGIIEGTPILDLAYEEDSNADVDMNIVCTGAGKFIEIQGTAEREPFTRDQMDEMLILAEIGVNKLFEIQRNALNI